METERAVPQPLAIVRDHLRAARDILIDEQKKSRSEEIDGVLDDVMMLLLRLKAVGSDARWAE